MIRIIIGALLLLTFALAVVGFILDPGTTQADIAFMIMAITILVMPGVGLVTWGALSVRKKRRIEREILRMYHRENRVDVLAVASTTNAREKLVRKVFDKLQKEGELPGVVGG